MKRYLLLLLLVAGTAHAADGPEPFPFLKEYTSTPSDGDPNSSAPTLGTDTWTSDALCYSGQAKIPCKGFKFKLTHTTGSALTCAVRVCTRGSDSRWACRPSETIPMDEEWGEESGPATVFLRITTCSGATINSTDKLKIRGGNL